MFFNRWMQEDRNNPACNDDSNVSLHDWLATYCLLIIPVVNIVLIIYWSCNSKMYPASKVNWARASLIILFFTTVMTGVFSVIYLLCRT